MSGKTKPKRRKPPRSKAALLPLPAATVREISLRQHSALAAFMHGYGNGEHVSVLMFAVYETYLMERAHTGAKPAPTPFLAADAALQRCAMGAQVTGQWSINETEAEPLAGVLELHDAQLAHYPSACYWDAWAKMNSAATARVSPLADGNVLPSDSPAFLFLMPATA